VWVIPGVIESKTCLLPMITPQSMALIALYRHYQNRCLPYAGGLLDQPNAYTEAMQLLDQQFNELKAELAKREQP
jgi:hypothetical protein